MSSAIREKKAAAIKFQFYQAFVSRIASTSFEQVHVADLCQDTKISKVTFFKYFPHKEDILRYYMRIWNLRLILELEEKELSGAALIRHVFDAFCSLYMRYPQMLVSFVSHVTVLDHLKAPFPVKKIEKELHFPEVAHAVKVEIKSIHQLFEGAVLDALMKGEITRMSDIQDISNMLMSLLYGSIITAHNQGTENIRFFYKKQLDLLFEALTQKSNFA